MNHNTYIPLTGLAYRAGRLIMGTDAVVSAIQENKVKLILLAADISVHTRSTIISAAENSGCLVTDMPCGKNELGGALGRAAVSVAALTDIGFASAIVERMATENPERYGELSMILKRKFQRMKERRAVQANKHKIPQSDKTDKQKSPQKDKSGKQKSPQKDKPRKQKSPQKDKPRKQKFPENDKAHKQKQKFPEGDKTYGRKTATTGPPRNHHSGKPNDHSGKSNDHSGKSNGHSGKSNGHNGKSNGHNGKFNHNRKPTDHSGKPNGHSGKFNHNRKFNGHNGKFNDRTKRNHPRRENHDRRDKS